MGNNNCCTSPTTSLPTDSINEAVVFIKPHVSSNPKFEALIRDIFLSKKIIISEEKLISGQIISSQKLLDQHYGQIAKLAMDTSAQEFYGMLTSEQMEKVVERFGEIEGFKLVNLKEFLEIFPKETYESVFEKWDEGKGTLLKVAGGTYLARLNVTVNEEGKELPIVMLNGFYGRVRGQYTADTLNLKVFLVRFAEKDLSWQQFRDEVIGATNPAAAVEGSIRNILLKKWEELGCESEPSMSDNGIHASASPIESVKEQGIWLGKKIDDINLARQLKVVGFNKALLNRVLGNEEIEINGDKGKAFDLFEMKDTSEVLEMARTMTSNL